MSSAITYDEVVRAAIRLIRDGQNVTKPAIREQLGNRGSHSTIQKHLDAWRETLAASDVEVLPPSMPPELTEHLEAFWNAAVSLVEDNLAGEWERAKQSVETAEAEKQAAFEDRDRWQEYVREKDVELAQRASEIEQVSKRLQDTEERLQTRDQEYQALLDRMDAKDRMMADERTAMQERIELIEQRHQQELDAAKSAWEAEKERLQEQAKAAQERAELEVRRSDQHEVYFLGEVRKARDETDQVRKDAEARVTRTEQELSLSHRREEAASLRLSKMEERLLDLERRYEDRGKEIESLRNVGQENEALRQDLATLTAERDQLTLALAKTQEQGYSGSDPDKE